MTGIHEGNVGARGDLVGTDVTYKPDQKTTLKGEFATSDRSVAGIDNEGTAWKLEALREDEKLSARAYARKQDPGFGLGQQAGSETGTRKIGGDARYRLSDSVQLDGQIYRQDTLTTDASREVAEGQVQWRRDVLTTQRGLRYVHDEYARRQGSAEQSGAGRCFLRAVRPQGQAEGERRSRPVRQRSKASIFRIDTCSVPNTELTELTTVFAEQEFARGENLSADMTRVGLRTSPWSGARDRQHSRQ